MKLEIKCLSVNMTRRKGELTSFSTALRVCVMLFTLDHAVRRSPTALDSLNAANSLMSDSLLSLESLLYGVWHALASSGSVFLLLEVAIITMSMCYDSLPWQHSFPCIFFSCHISLPGIPLLCLSSLSSYPGTPHVHCMRPLTPMPFIVLLLDRGYPFFPFS